MHKITHFSYIKALLNKYNIFLLKLMNHILGASAILTKYLQDRNIDPINVAEKVADYRKTLQNLDNENDFEKFLRMCGDMDVAVANRHRYQAHRFGLNEENGDHVHDQTGTNKLKIVYHQILHSFEENLDFRFDDIEKYSWVRLFHPSTLHSAQYSSASLSCMVDQFHELYPSIPIDNETVTIEWNALRRDSTVKLLIEKDGIVDSAGLLSLMVKYNLNEALPSIYKMMSLAVSIPLTSVSCERTFSALKRVKSYIRSAMSQQRVKSLLLLATEKTIINSLRSQSNFYDDIIDIFADMKDRRIKLKYKN